MENVCLKMNGAVWKVCIQSEVERGGQEKSQ